MLKPSIEALSRLVTEEPLGPPDSPEIRTKILEFKSALERLTRDTRATWYLDEGDALVALVANFDKSIAGYDEDAQIDDGYGLSPDEQDNLSNEMFREAEMMVKHAQQIAQRLGIEATVSMRYDQKTDWCYVNIFLAEPWESAVHQYF